MVLGFARKRFTRSTKETRLGQVIWPEQIGKGEASSVDSHLSFNESAIPIGKHLILERTRSAIRRRRGRVHLVTPGNHQHGSLASFRYTRTAFRTDDNIPCVIWGNQFSICWCGPCCRRAQRQSKYSHLQNWPHEGTNLRVLFHSISPPGHGSHFQIVRRWIPSWERRCGIGVKSRSKTSSPFLAIALPSIRTWFMPLSCLQCRSLLA
jgi:hypothetical protein